MACGDKPVVVTGSMRPADAIARKAELMADAAWADRYLKGGQTEAREMTRINTMIDGEAA